MLYCSAVSYSQVLLVAGGYGKGGGLSSTELLPTNTSAWVKANPLPRKLYYVRGITMDDVLYMTGEGRGGGCWT